MYYLYLLAILEMFEINLASVGWLIHLLVIDDSGMSVDRYGRHAWYRRLDLLMKHTRILLKKIASLLKAIRKALMYVYICTYAGKHYYRPFPLYRKYIILNSYMCTYLQSCEVS